MKPVPLYQVDAFTDRAFAGNPAAVCLLTEPRPEGWMQDVAMEMNLSETAYLTPREQGFDLRWFTPTREVELCGHATLASAHVLWSEVAVPEKALLRFFTRSGVLAAARRGEWIELDFPSYPPEPRPDPAVTEALGVDASFVGRHGDNYVVEVASESALRGVEPDFRRLRDLGAGAIVTSRSDEAEFDYVCRYFAPAFGVDEDPVTGSAQCYLAPYWRDRLGRSELRARQVSRRGGVAKVRVEGDRIGLCGRAVTVMRGELAA